MNRLCALLCFRPVTNNKESKENNEKKATDFFKTTYGILSKIPAVTVGNPCGDTASVRSCFSMEAGCKRVKINKIYVPSEVADDVKKYSHQPALKI